MTGETVLILGEVGHNFGAGMTGGLAYVWDPDVKLKGRIAETAPDAQRPTVMDTVEIRSLIDEHLEHTTSPTARSLLSRFPQALDSFWVIAASGSANTRLAGEAGPSSVEMV